jgi:hypothetical protein
MRCTSRVPQSIEVFTILFQLKFTEIKTLPVFFYLHEWDYRYIYIYIYIDYGASRSTKPPMLRVRIANLKVQMADPNVEHDLHIEISLEIKF